MPHLRIWSTGLMALLMLATPALTLEQMAAAAPSLHGSASVTVKSRQKKPASTKQANPRVPYILSSGGKPVMIPQSLADLLKAPAVELPESTNFVRRFSLHPVNPEVTSAPYKTATELLQQLQPNTSLFYHMEALRQGYIELPKHEKNDLLVRLLSRYEAAPDNAVSYFDYGYAQLLYLDNQTGLFFLRKANEQLQNSATALAYAIGQAQVDLNQEKAKPEEMTMRKLDVIHKLSDALALDLKAHQAGFWPFYMQTVQKLDLLPSYQGLAKKDFSLSYVPLGKQLAYTQLQGYQPAADIYNLAATALEKATPDKKKKAKAAPMPQQIKPEPAVVKADDASAVGMRLLPNGNQIIKFTAIADTAQVQVTVLDAAQHQKLVEFQTQGGRNVVEDLDNDGHYELVVRQFRETPFEPVRVYRWTGQGYELDSNIAQLFH